MLRVLTSRTLILLALLVVPFSLIPRNANAAIVTYPVTAGNVWGTGSLVIGMRTGSGCDIRANGVSIPVSPTLSTFICQMKMLGATDLGSMTIDTENPNRMVGYFLTRSQNNADMVRFVGVFNEQQPETERSTYIAVNTSGPAGNGVMMNSPDQAVIAATAVVLNRKVAVTHYGPSVPIFYPFSATCGMQAGSYYATTNYPLATITLL